MKVSVIGSGFAGLSASATLARLGHEVTVFEKNGDPGGRARQHVSNGFTFDMGPSWYWLPDVFEKFFSSFGKTPSDYYQLIKLDPGYRIFFGKNDYHDVPANQEKLFALFELLEPGSSNKLKKFLKEAAFKYNLAMNEFIYKPGLSITELTNPKIIKGILQVSFFRSMSSYVRSLFKNPKLIKILEFPVIFLGASPADTPALYSLMNHADLTLGTWYPMGGMYEVVKALVQLNESLGVDIKYNNEIESFNFTGNRILGINTGNKSYKTEAIIAGADYHYIDQKLLPNGFREYHSSYWEKRKMAPSALLYYLGFNKKIKNLEHHNLFFDTDFEKHVNEIYKDPKWPSNPAMYVSCSSKTDSLVAPAGNENLVILIPVASGLSDSPALVDHYLEMALSRLEGILDEPLKKHLVYQKTYTSNDFKNDYHSYKGNAYGLSNTLLQTANLKPRMHSRKIPNLFYCGQLTVPGPGVPPALISGEIAAQILNNHKKNKL